MNQALYAHMNNKRKMKKKKKEWLANGGQRDLDTQTSQISMLQKNVGIVWT
jgi:hypothetical protein